MFWKKRRIDPPLFIHESYDRRKAYRLSPSSDNPVCLRLADAPQPVTDISAGGLSFVSEELSAGDRLAGELILPSCKTLKIPVTLDVIRIDPPHYCRCAFTDMSPDHIEAIHHYIWITQRRAQKKRPSPDRKDEAL